MASACIQQATSGHEDDEKKSVLKKLKRKNLTGSLHNRIVARSTMGTAFYLFSHQVGGHKPFLRSAPGEVCKPAIPKEVAFYESLEMEYPALRPFVPNYKGTIDVDMQLDEEEHETCDEEHSSPSRTSACNSSEQDRRVPPSTPGTAKGIDQFGSPTPTSGRKKRRRGSRTPRPAEFSYKLWEKIMSENRQKNYEDGVVAVEEEEPPVMYEYIVLEDLTQGYKRPSVLDIKMGTRQHGMHALPEKRNSQMEKCKATTSYELGLRFCGMQTYQSNIGEYILKDKHWGRALNKNDIIPALKLYLSNGLLIRMDVLELLLERIKALRQVIESLSGIRFWGASLLLIYDGEIVNRAEEASQPVKVDVRMIDFAHSHSDIDAFPTADDGYLVGLTNLISFLTEIQAESAQQQSSSYTTKNKACLINMNNHHGGHYLDVFPDE